MQCFTAKCYVHLFLSSSLCHKSVNLTVCTRTRIEQDALVVAKLALLLLPLASSTILRLPRSSSLAHLFSTLICRPPPRLIVPLPFLRRHTTLMAPKAPKRKAASPVSDAEASGSSDHEEEQKKAPKAKKAKAPAKGPVTPIDPSLPHNLKFPENLQPFPAKKEGEIRISTWNVCGIKACDKKVRMGGLQVKQGASC